MDFGTDAADERLPALLTLSNATVVQVLRMAGSGKSHCSVQSLDYGQGRAVLIRGGVTPKRDAAMTPGSPVSLFRKVSSVNHRS